MLGEVIKQIAGSAANTQPPCTFIFGTVVSTDPLSVQVDNRFFVGESALVLLKPSVSGSFCSHTHKHTCAYNGAEITDKEDSETYCGLKAGDKLALLREHGGQRFLVLGVVA